MRWFLEWDCTFGKRDLSDVDYVYVWADALLVLMIQTGIRASEITGLRIGDVHLGIGAHIRVISKGRKTRSPTLTRETVTVIRAWLKERRGQPDEPLFPTQQGQPPSRYTVTRQATTAAVDCPSLAAHPAPPPCSCASKASIS